MRYILREVYYYIISIILRIKNRNLRICYRAKATRKSKFEGYNKLDHHAWFSGELGYASYVGANSVVAGKIGRFCSIADNVIFISKTHPVKKFVSSHPCFYSIKKQSGFTYVSKQLFDEEQRNSIKVGNDVYIGYGAIIIGPCKIGNGAVIAGGAVVTGDIPDYAIAGGVPAKIIRYRFSEQEIDFLHKLQWWNKSSEWLRKNAKYFDSVDKLKAVVENSKDEEVENSDYIDTTNRVQ